MKETWEEKQEISEGGSAKRPRSIWNKCVQKQKEGCPLGKTNKTDDDDDRGDTEAMLRLIHMYPATKSGRSESGSFVIDNYFL